jgi:DNA-binding MarR family transcriptional regulator
MKQLHNVSQPGVTLGRLVVAAELIGRLTNQLAASHGLSRPRAELLAFARDHGPIVQRELSEALQCTPRNVTDLVDSLEAAGLVVRAAHPHDRRATLVNLTSKGQTLATQLRADETEFAARLFADLADDELEAFATILDWTIGRLRSSVQKV